MQFHTKGGSADMREERGRIAGDIVVYEPFTLWGSIAGNVKVINGGKLYVRGAIYGHLDVEPGGRVHIFGNITGDLTVGLKTKVIHSGVIGGDAINRGGRLYIESMARVFGKVNTKSGETKNDIARG
jgi:cytoskeletal protein CcmA (bactofilin family)